MGDSAISNPEADTWNGSQHGTEGPGGGGVSDLLAHLCGWEWSCVAEAEGFCCGPVGLGLHCGAAAESSTQFRALVHIPEGF